MLHTILYLITIAVCLGVTAVIFQKAGYSRIYTLLMLIPIVNLVWLVIFAASDWPVLREVSRRRLEAGEAADADAQRILSFATRLDQRGEWDSAVRLYDLITRSLPGTEIANDAAVLRRSVTEKQQAATT
jgi:hypothetical protein